MFRIIALLLCAASTGADYVVDWRVPVANDNNPSAWVAEVVVPLGEKVVLEWTDYFAFHNVFRMKDKAAYDACDFEGAVELAPVWVSTSTRRSRSYSPWPSPRLRGPWERWPPGLCWRARPSMVWRKNWARSL